MKFVYVCAALAASLATTEAGGAVELSEDNFGKKMAGKNAIIKFLAPVSNTSAREQIQRGSGTATGTGTNGPPEAESIE